MHVCDKGRQGGINRLLLWSSWRSPATIFLLLCLPSCLTNCSGSWMQTLTTAPAELHSADQQLAHRPLCATASCGFSARLCRLLFDRQACIPVDTAGRKLLVRITGGCSRIRFSSDSACVAPRTNPLFASKIDRYMKRRDTVASACTKCLHQLVPHHGVTTAPLLTGCSARICCT